MLMLRSILLASISLLALPVGNEIRMIVVDIEMLPQERQTHHKERSRQTKVAARNWRKPNEKWIRRIH